VFASAGVGRVTISFAGIETEVVGAGEVIFAAAGFDNIISAVDLEFGLIGCVSDRIIELGFGAIIVFRMVFAAKLAAAFLLFTAVWTAAEELVVTFPAIGKLAENNWLTLSFRTGKPALASRARSNSSYARLVRL
jgi:hypothetical protein